MRTETSCGLIPFSADRTAVLLVRHNAGHWGFPKGHDNPGESHINTALRECAEEIGLCRGDLLWLGRSALQERYTLQRHDGKRAKTVWLWPALVRAGFKPHHQRGELLDARWVALADAARRLDFAAARQALAAACTRLP